MCGLLLYKYIVYGKISTKFPSFHDVKYHNCFKHKQKKIPREIRFYGKKKLACFCELPIILLFEWKHMLRIKIPSISFFAYFTYSKSS